MFLERYRLTKKLACQNVIVQSRGVTFSVAAGSPVGKEGPMVHSGVVVSTRRFPNIPIFEMIVWWHQPLTLRLGGGGLFI